MQVNCRRKNNFDKITACSTSDNFEVSLQRRVASLCNQLLPGFASNQFETLYRYYKHNEDVHMILASKKISFDKITAFWKDNLQDRLQWGNKFV